MTALYTMKIITDFSAAHLLRGYPGPCSRLHGHNWKIEVIVKATKLDSIGMGLDFSDIKKATKELIGNLDHRNLNDIPPFDSINPTAENVSAYLYTELSKTINTTQIKVDAITLWETERACVTYTEED
jgi:6-pyruvoyltetrahydropterin/6-carboxytetrahydropterin synthase